MINDYFSGLDNMFSKNKWEFLKLIAECKQYNSEDVAMIFKALYKAEELHSGQYRKSGEPYINHPIGAASILARLGLDSFTIAGTLLHDTVEDTNYTLSECEKDFNPTIAKLVDGVTKIGNDVNKPTHEKIINGMMEEPRILAIKSGDRLHNMKTLEALSEKKQIEIANETKTFYIPITKILGIYKLTAEFQDLCTYYLHRNEFIKLYKQKELLKDEYYKTLISLGEEARYKLSGEGIALKYDYRIKNVGAIYQELKTKKSEFDIEDLFAIKLILKEIDECYKAMDVIKSVSLVKQNTFFDYIKNPKYNGYKSLNTDVKYSDIDIQIRIRTNDMQNTNTLGIFSDLNEDAKDKLTNYMKKKLENLKG